MEQHKQLPKEERFRLAMADILANLEEINTLTPDERTERLNNALTSHGITFGDLPEIFDRLNLRYGDEVPRIQFKDSE